MKPNIDPFRASVIIALAVLTVYLVFALANPFIGGVP